MKRLTVRELAGFASAHAAEKPLLLDVREPWEFALASVQVPGLETRHLPMGEVAQRLSELDTDRPVVCLCHHGMRSAHVATWLAQQAGFEAVYNLDGGIDAWSREIDPTVPRY
jgi:rhodanese-related sulfurtransferase